MRLNTTQKRLDEREARLRKVENENVSVRGSDGNICPREKAGSFRLALYDLKSIPLTVVRIFAKSTAELFSCKFRVIRALSHVLRELCSCLPRSKKVELKSAVNQTSNLKPTLLLLQRDLLDEIHGLRKRNYELESQLDMARSSFMDKDEVMPSRSSSSMDIGYSSQVVVTPPHLTLPDSITLLPRSGGDVGSYLSAIRSFAE